MPQRPGTASAACPSRHSLLSLKCSVRQRKAFGAATAVSLKSRTLHWVQAQDAWTRPALPLRSCWGHSLQLGCHSSLRALRCVAAASSSTSAEHGPQPTTWEQQTQRLVAVSTLPFLLLMMPQVIKNASNFMAGNARALAALSWVVSPLLS